MHDAVGQHPGLAAAGSGDDQKRADVGQTGQEIGGVMLPFDDVSVVREALVQQGFHPSQAQFDPAEVKQ